ncbi:hypothetical protein [Arthrobacter sp. 179]|uniref:hypothetical protein n=1 Tax=Arthrobacter sp. 179 TaxID=3457734 RepID=UPI004033AB9D
MAAIIAATATFTRDTRGEPLTAYVASGEPAQMSLVNTRSGHLVSSAALNGGAGQSVSTRALATGAKDRKIYIGLQDGRAYSYDVDTRKLVKLPAGPAMSRDAYWNAAGLDDGRILFTTYPTARLLAYDPKDETWRDFGRLGAKNKYSMGISTVRNIAYVGTGTADPALWQVDTLKGTKRRIPLPESKKNVKRDFVYDTAVVGTHVFARVDSEDVIYAYDAQERKWGGEISGAVRGLAASEPGEPAALYWVSSSGELHSTEVASDRDHVLAGGESVSTLRGHTWQKITGERASLVTINVSGDILRWDRDKDKLTQKSSAGTPAPVQIRCLGVESEGRVLVGGYGTTSYFVELSGDGAADVQHALRGQIESFGTSGDDLLVGTYPGAIIHLLHGGSDSFSAPVASWSLEQGQDRPVAIEDLGEGRAAIASIPVYGRSGGALTFLHVEDGIEKAVTNIAPNRSPLTLAHSKGRLYVGTGATGGLGTARDPGDGTVILVDSHSGQIEKTVIPVPGDATVSTLMFDADGMLWGWSVDTIFELDSETLKVKRKKRYSKARDTKSYARGRNLVDVGQQLAGCARGKVFLIDKADLTRRDIARGGNLVLSGNGELYYSRGSKVYRWSFVSGASA